jgi:hypothetical protein
MITKNQLIISCIFNGGNLLFLIYYIYDIIVRYTDLEHITRWSYYLNSIYTTINLFCDIMEYLSQEDQEDVDNQKNYNLMIDNDALEPQQKFEKLKEWNRNDFSVICNTLCYYVSIGFWSLFLLGNNLMSVSTSIKSVFNCIYHHCIIQIVILVDIFTFKRKIHFFSWFYLGILYAIFIVYCLIIYVEKYFFGRNAYIFMNGSSTLFLLLCLFIGSLFLYPCYLLHIYLVKSRNTKTEKEIY